jgi:hypothetical protein
MAFLTSASDVALLFRISNFILGLNVVTDLPFAGVVDSKHGRKIHFIEKNLLSYLR